MKRPIIIGGGISGLSTAAWLDDAIVLESKESIGGWVKSKEHPLGFSVDLAANGWLDNEPAVAELIKHIHKTEEILPASAERKIRWVYHKNNLVALPAKPPMILSSPLLSIWSKIRLFWELFVSRSKNTKEESVAEFVTRRLGKGVIPTLLAPMTAGVFAAQPEELSLRAAFPMLEKMEQEHGSLLKALRNRPKLPPPTLTSLKSSAGSLCTHIGDILGERLHTSTPATQIYKDGSLWNIVTPTETLQTENLVLACPAFVQSKLLSNVDSELSSLLQSIQYTSVALVISIYKKEELSPTGFGALVARGTELFGALGILFSSCIFPSRYPSEYTVTRTILGGTRYPQIVSMSEEEIGSRVQKAHQHVFQREVKPIEQMVYIHNNAIPLYSVGHAQKQEKIRSMSNKHRGLYLIGNHLFGVGVKDCIRNGTSVARAIQTATDKE